MARILFTNKASLNYPGGAEVRIKYVSSRLCMADHEVYMICAKTSCTEKPISIQNGAILRCIKVMPDKLLKRFPPPHYLPQALFYLVAPIYIPHYIRKWKIDAIRDDMSPFPGLSMLAPIYGPKSVVVVHNLFGGYKGWREYYPKCYAAAGALGERMLFNGNLRYKAVVTDSYWLARYIRNGTKKDLIVRPIPNGVDLENIPTRTARSIRKMISVGRFTKHKSIFDILDACMTLKVRDTDFELDFYGAGELEEAMRVRIKLFGLEESVHIYPPLPHRELMQRLKDYDLFIMASKSEGLPTVMLEAMAAKLPVIAPLRPYSTELASSYTVNFYNPNYEGDMARMIEDVMTFPNRAEEKASTGLTWVQDFTWEKAAAAEQKLIEEVLLK